MWEVLGVLAGIVAIGGPFGVVDRLVTKAQESGRSRGGDSSTPGGYYSDLG
jgi:hypothetical protein